MLDALGVDRAQRRRAERPRPLVGGGAQVDEAGEGDEAEGPVPPPAPAGGEAGEGDQAHPEQDETGARCG